VPPSLDSVVPPLLAFMVVPTYEYECPKCPRVFEVKQRITAPKLETCDRCGGPVHRLLSATPFILKGGGWYVTDYPSAARKEGSKSESTSSDAAPAAPSTAAEKSSTGTAPSSSSGEKVKTEPKTKSEQKAKGEPAAKPKASGSSSSSS
jgi:putative FmdB family regulatory protein